MNLNTVTEPGVDLVIAASHTNTGDTDISAINDSSATGDIEQELLQEADILLGHNGQNVETTLVLFRRLRGPAEVLRAGDRTALRDHLVLVHAPLVEHCARGFAASGEPVEDLVQEGYVGLIKAVDRFDPDKGVRFSTYACHLITGEIRHYLRDLGKLIHEPGWHFELRQRIIRTTDQLTHQLARTPGPEDVAVALNIPLETVRDVLRTQSTLTVDSLDREGDGDDESEGRKLDVPSPGGPLESGVDNRHMLDVALPQLRDLEKRVITMFFFEERSKTDIARQLGISINYAAYLIKKGIESLREILEAGNILPGEVLSSPSWPQSRARAAYLLALAKSAGAVSVGPSPMLQPETLAATALAGAAFDEDKAGGTRRERRRTVHNAPPGSLPVVAAAPRSNMVAFSQWVSELDDEVQRAARYAQEFGLLWLRCTNWNEVTSTLSPEHLKSVRHAAQSCARRSCRNVDRVSLLPPGAMPGLNFLILMPHTGAGGARAGGRWLQACRPETLLPGEPQALAALEFRFAYAVFPHDGKSPDALFSTLGSHLKLERRTG